MAVVLIAGGVAVHAATSNDHGRTLVQGVDKLPAVRQGSWRAVNLGKPGVLSPQLFWTGTRVLAFYQATPEATLVDGELYDPATDQARPISRGSLAWRAGAAVVWTGRELIVWGGTSGQADIAEGGAYNPATDRWRALSRAPGGAGVVGEAVWTGAEMVLPARALAYNPAADSWRRIARFPLGPRRTSSIVWTGREVIVWGGCDLDSVQCDDASPTTATGEGAAYDPRTDRWRLLPRSPLAQRQRPQAVWTGTEMIMWGGRSIPSGRGAWGAAYNPRTDGWRTVRNSPFPPRSDAVLAWTGREMLVWGGLNWGSGDRFLSNGASYDPATDRWSLLPPSPLTARDRAGYVWTGRDLYIVGGYPGGGGAAFTPTG